MSRHLPGPQALLRVLLALLLASALASHLAGAAGPPLADGAPGPARTAALLAEHQRLAGALRDSVFGEPLLLLTSGPSPAADAGQAGEVVMLLPRPLASVAAVFASPASLCAMLDLHLNVRSCSPSAEPGSPVLDLVAGPMRQSLPGLVYPLRLVLQSDAASPGYFGARFGVADGPTNDARLQVQLQAVAVGSSHSYLHVHYRQRPDLATQFATRLYLATAGRAKIGFSPDGVAADGRPRFVGGERGALERNLMRHYLALLVASAPAPAGTPAARRDARLRAWFALTERHPSQLHELDLADYLREKQGNAPPTMAAPPP